jgi:hypothetical protein
LFFLIIPIVGYGQIWRETFSGLSNGTTVDNGSTKWTTIQPSGSSRIFSKQTYASYVIFAVNDTYNEGSWVSEEIDISSAAEVTIEITWGSYWANSTDYLRAYYKLDGGEEVLFGEETGKPNLQIASTASAIVSGSTVQIIIKGMENTIGNFFGYPRMMGIDDVTVSELTYLYSRSSGNWSNTVTWSSSGYTGSSCYCTPDENTHVFIGNSRIVNLNANVESAGVTIEDNGRINYTANARLNIVRGGLLDIGTTESITNNSGVSASLSFSTYNYNALVNGSMTVDNIVIDGANVLFEGAGTIDLSGDLDINNVISKTIQTDLENGFTIQGGIHMNNTSGNLDFENTGELSAGELLFDNDNVTFTNNGNMELGTGNIRVNNFYDNGNVFNNQDTLTLNGFNLNNGDFTINNSGTIVQTGDFSGISSNSYFNNLSGGSWIFEGGGNNTRLFTSAENNTFSYSNTGDQTIISPADGAYHHLKLEGSGIKTLSGSMAVNGNLEINETAQLDVSDSNYNLTIDGDWALNSSHSDPFIERNGTVTLSGTTGQLLSASNGTISLNNLTVNKTGNITLSSSPSTNLVLNTITLTNGGLDLSHNSLEVLDPSTSAMSRTNGFIISETNAYPYSRIIWHAETSIGAYTFPFGKSGGDYIPFVFNKTTSGTGSGSISVATYATAQDNIPYPSGVLNLGSSGNPDISDLIVDRFWQIDLNGYATNPTADITFNATSTEVGLIGSPKAQRWNSGTSDWDAPLPGQTNPDGYSVTVPNVNSFSPWTLSDGSTPLPVDILSFMAFNKNNSVLLTWQTINEANNDYFILERSIDLSEFTKIGTIEGNGNSKTKQHYEFTDKNPIPGSSHYRLKQVDYDGSEHISGYVAIQRDGVPQVQFYPNPFTGNELNILLPSGIADAEPDIHLFDIYGHEINISFKKSTDNNLIKLYPDKNLSKGTYLIHVSEEAFIFIINQ